MAISPQTLEHSRELKAERKLRFDVLVDPGNAVSDQFGLTWTLPDEMKSMYLQWGIDLEQYNGDDSWRLPMSARYIVDRDMRIAYAEYDVDYMTRPEPEDTIEALRGLAKQA